MPVPLSPAAKAARRTRSRHCVRPGSWWLNLRPVWGLPCSKRCEALEANIRGDGLAGAPPAGPEKMMAQQQAILSNSSAHALAALYRDYLAKSDLWSIRNGPSSSTTWTTRPVGFSPALTVPHAGGAGSKCPPWPPSPPVPVRSSAADIRAAHLGFHPRIDADTRLSRARAPGGQPRSR